MSKKSKIRELTAEGLTAKEIAEQVDTTTSYVYKCRSSGNDSSPEESSEPSGTTESTESTESSEPSESLEFGDQEAEQRDLPEGDSDPDSMQEETAEELDLQDSGGKVYNCGECGADLEYLQKSCECGARPAWSAIAE